MNYTTTITLYRNHNEDAKDKIIDENNCSINRVIFKNIYTVWDVPDIKDYYYDLIFSIHNDFIRKITYNPFIINLIQNKNIKIYMKEKDKFYTVTTFDSTIDSTIDCTIKCYITCIDDKCANCNDMINKFWSYKLVETNLTYNPIKKNNKK